MMNNLKEQILSKILVDSESGCWIWNGSFLKSGAPCLSFNRKTLTAKRCFYEEFIGLIDDRRIFVVNSCGNKKCCNPAHLELSKKGYIFNENHERIDKLDHDEKRRRESERKKRYRVPKEKLHELGVRMSWAEFLEKKRTQTHCKHGHTLDDAIIKSGRRYCRTCDKLYRERSRERMNEYQRNYRANKK